MANITPKEKDILDKIRDGTTDLAELFSWADMCYDDWQVAIENLIAAGCITYRTSEEMEVIPLESG